MNEIQLLQAAAANADAFVELYHLHSARVYRYHMAHTGDAKDAEDLTAQTFMTALESLRAFRGGDSFAAWIMSLATQKRTLSVRASRPELPNDAVLYYQGSGLPTDKAAMQRLELETLFRALKQIPAERAEALILYFFGNLPSTEISRILKKNPTATEQLIARGLQDLSTRTSLTPQEEDEALPDKLTQLAYRILPDPLFIQELEDALLAKHVPYIEKTSRLQPIASFAGWLALVALTVFLLNWRVVPPAATKKTAATPTSATAVAQTGSTRNQVATTPKPTTTARPTATRIPTLEYIVQAGDTCTFIAERYGITIDQLTLYNKLNNACDIWVNQTLNIPILITATP